MTPANKGSASLSACAAQLQAETRALPLKEPLVDLRDRRQTAPHMAGPVMLIIRDGWGINPGGREKREENSDATLLAQTPFHDQLYRDYPGAKLSTSGADVGLPDGQMGNSEVGHLNLGAGRIVYQDLTRINEAIANGELARNGVLQAREIVGFTSSGWFPMAVFTVITRT